LPKSTFLYSRFFNAFQSVSKEFYPYLTKSMSRSFTLAPCPLSVSHSTATATSSWSSTRWYLSNSANTVSKSSSSIATNISSIAHALCFSRSYGANLRRSRSLTQSGYTCPHNPLYCRHASLQHVSNFYRLWRQDFLILRIPAAFVGHRVMIAHRLNLALPCAPTWNQRVQLALPTTFSPLNAVAEVGLERLFAHFKHRSIRVTF